MDLEDHIPFIIFPREEEDLAGPVGRGLCGAERLSPEPFFYDLIQLRL